MRVKVFHSRNRNELEKQLNSWLGDNMVSPESMRFQFSSVVIEDSTEWMLEHTLILFYVPLQAI